MLVGGLPDGEGLREQALDLGLGAEALLHQPLGGSHAVLAREGQGVPGQLVQVSQRQGLVIIPAGQGNPAGKDAGVLVGKALVAQLAQQGGAELGGGNGVLLPGDDSDPALGHGVVVSAGGQIGLGEPVEPGQHLRRMGPAGLIGQRLPGGGGVDDLEGRQGIRGPLGLARQGGGSGSQPQKQGQHAEQGENLFFHGTSLRIEYSLHCSTVEPALQGGGCEREYPAVYF